MQQSVAKRKTESLDLNATALSNQCTDKPERTKLDFFRDAAGTNIKYRSITGRWDQDPIYRASLRAEGGPWARRVVLWDDIAVNGDKSKRFKVQSHKAERATIWNGSKIVIADKIWTRHRR